MEYLALETLIEKPISGEWGTGDGDVNVIRSANFTNHGRINFDKIVARNIPDDKVKTKKLQEEDIIIEKSGGSPTQPVGRVVFFDKKGTYLCSNFTSILRPLKQYVAPKYLHYILFCNHKFGFVEKYQNKTTGIINLQLPKYLKNTKVPLPPLAEQQKIASILDAADSLRQKDQQLIKKYTALSQSLFLEMFGDPETNPMGWEVRTIEKILDRKSQNGLYLTKDKYQSTGIEMVHMSDAFYGIVSPGNLKKVILTDHELEKYKLSTNDLLLARRSLTYEGAAKPCLIPEYNKNIVYESSLIRVTPKKKLANSLYLYFFFSNKGARNKFVNKYISRSTISGINNKGLNSIQIPLPPINLQNQFAERIQAIEAQKQLAQASLKKSDDLFNSLLQRAFKGELTA